MLFSGTSRYDLNPTSVQISYKNNPVPKYTPRMDQDGYRPNLSIHNRLRRTAGQWIEVGLNMKVALSKQNEQLRKGDHQVWRLEQDAATDSFACSKQCVDQHNKRMCQN